MCPHIALPLQAALKDRLPYSPGGCLVLQRSKMVEQDCGIYLTATHHPTRRNILGRADQLPHQSTEMPRCLSRGTTYEDTVMFHPMK
ncbi:hypothetical protein MRX96_028942 [Rhipicephalus microplus]